MAHPQGDDARFKRCPSCGGGDMSLSSAGFKTNVIFSVFCRSCGMMSGGRNSEAEAIEAWNRRSE